MGAVEDEMQFLSQLDLERLQGPCSVYLRVALATAFLSAVADRFGLWGPFGTANVAWGDFERFAAYVGKLNWFVPAGLVPLVAWVSTVAELILGITPLIGLAMRLSARLSGLLLLAFALSMAVALGPQAPLSFSVFTASAGSFLLAALPEPAYIWTVDRLARARRAGALVPAAGPTPEIHQS
jgi:uncharacterized membrane protein YphA (DoxX/SURF4 family)